MEPFDPRRYNWDDIIEQLMHDEQMRESVDAKLKHFEVLQHVHPESGPPASVKAAWPYLISAHTRIDVTGPITIGPYFMMNKFACILRHRHPVYRDLPSMLQCMACTQPSEELVIEEDVWMQEHSTVLPAVSHIHEGTILGVRSVLTHNTDRPYGIWIGSPAVCIKERPHYGAS